MNINIEEIMLNDVMNVGRNKDKVHATETQLCDDEEHVD